jgi:hypothetical protein
MRSHPTALSFFKVILLVLCMTLAASAKLPTRGSSGNGQDSNGANWMLVARSQPIKLSANGKSAMMSREVICLNQDVEDAFFSPTATLVGSCDSGVYMHLFQFQSISANVFVAIGKLVGFVASTGSNPNLGIMLCDDPTLGNTVEMCTNTAAANIPNITFTNSKTSITFTVSGTFPSYPAGTAEQGQGLTFFVITNQAAPLPIQWPSVSIH